MQIKKELFQRGNSIAVIIPVEICKQLKLSDGNEVFFDIENNRITISPLVKVIKWQSKNRDGIQI